MSTHLRAQSLATVTDVGRHRRRNEDRIFTSGNLFAIADGMGGQSRGDRAAECVTEALEDAEPALRGELTQTETTDLIRDALIDASRCICDMVDGDLDATTATKILHRGAAAGSTVAGIHLGEIPVVFHVGDSRVYRYRAPAPRESQAVDPEGESESGASAVGTLTRLTHDHSLVQEMVDDGLLDETEAHFHPRRNIITRAVGTYGPPDVEFTTVDLEVGDIVLMCSDGLSDELLDNEIAMILSETLDESLESAAYALRDMAISAGGHDNISIVLIEIGDSP